ncbi:MAG TPA: adenosylcobinamide-phosphate synthase CbiB [Acidimicrobiales bacterium]|jgi:adenosylcobinamide-phosphate synthase|nr:adenosylcobinamide-phosphate synthase CbiB [Acidimicrobiales bacterium]
MVTVGRVTASRMAGGGRLRGDRRPGSRAIAVAVALVADRALGEPPAGSHPVARFGQVMERVETRMWADRRGRGAAYAAVGVGSAVLIGRALSVGPPIGQVALLAAATYVAIAGRALEDAARAVEEALISDDLGPARDRLRNLVGRRTADLDETEIIRATVESVAENTVDAVVAPLLWALGAGPTGVLGYRAANTLDAMVGHRSPRYERFGWAAARVDDVANWIPARVTAAVVMLCRPGAAGQVVEAVRRQAPAHPSPNAGVAEAAFAAALGVQLGGVNDYAGRVERRPLLGSGGPPERCHIAEACRLSRQVSYVCVALAAGLQLGRRR